MKYIIFINKTDLNNNIDIDKQKYNNIVYVLISRLNSNT